MNEVCMSLLDCAYDFQTLASGILAVAAALIGGRYVVRSSRLPIQAQKAQNLEMERRKAAHVARVLGVELMRVAELARQAAGTIRAVVAANKDVTDVTRSKTIINPHPLIDDVEAMSLLPPHLARMALDIRSCLLRHNFDMMRAGGSFGDDNFQRHVHSQAEDLASRATQMTDYFLKYGEELSRPAKS